LRGPDLGESEESPLITAVQISVRLDTVTQHFAVLGLIPRWIALGIRQECLMKKVAEIVVKTLIVALLCLAASTAIGLNNHAASIIT